MNTENIEAGSRVVTAVMFSGLYSLITDVCFFILHAFFPLYMFILQCTVFPTGCASVFILQFYLHERYYINKPLRCLNSICAQRQK